MVLSSVVVWAGAEPEFPTACVDVWHYVSSLVKGSEVANPLLDRHLAVQTGRWFGISECSGRHHSRFGRRHSHVIGRNSRVSHPH